jgi:2-polyprenyl-3-methyl-5-hydroxy-6-metoxy-1,4-benzoquinol methylase
MKYRIPFDACPLCGGQRIKMLCRADCSAHALYNQIIPRVMNWMRCDDCAHVFTDGYFPPDLLATIFQRTHDNQKPGWNFEQQRNVSARMVGNVARYAEGGAWLDVGFGNGSLLFTAEEWGFEPVGLDLRSASVEAMCSLNFEAHCLDVTTFDNPGRFSVVSMADVLEHMPFPKDGLAAAHRLLASHGILFVSMPNYNCAVWRLLDTVKANPYWAELEHYHNFSRARLYALLKECSFEPLHYTISERYRVCMEVIARRR